MPGPDGPIGLVAQEIMERHPANRKVDEYLVRPNFDDLGEDELGETIFDLWTAAYALGRAAERMVAECGQPGPETGYEPYLAELVRRSGLDQVPGHVTPEGHFECDDEA
jgi:hypothetical protein